jgi:hypothetical protein
MSAKAICFRQDAGAKIEAAFGRLPHHELSPWSSDLLIEKYLYMAFDFDEYEPSVSETAKQLDNVATSSRTLFKHVALLQGPAGDALRARARSILELPTDSAGRLHFLPNLSLLQLEALLLRLGETASLAKNDLPAASRGPKPKRRAARIADAAADDFCKMTLKPPTRITLADGKMGGPFIDFLDNLFKALGLEEVSADHYGKEAIQNWRDGPHASPAITIEAVEK